MRDDHGGPTPADRAASPGDAGADRDWSPATDGDAAAPGHDADGDGERGGPVTRRSVLRAVGVGLPAGHLSTGPESGGASPARRAVRPTAATGFGAGGFGAGGYGGGEEAPAWARFDTDDRPGIQFREVLDAIAAFNRGDPVGGEPVTFRDVLAVIAAFNRGG